MNFFNSYPTYARKRHLVSVQLINEDESGKVKNNRFSLIGWKVVREIKIFWPSTHNFSISQRNITNYWENMLNNRPYGIWTGKWRHACI